MHDAIRVAMEFLLNFGETNFVEVLKSTKYVKFTALKIRAPYGILKNFLLILKYQGAIATLFFLGIRLYMGTSLFEAPTKTLSLKISYLIIHM